MLKQLQQLRTLLLALLVMAGAGNGWGQTTATINFKSNGGTKINAASVTGNDDQGNTWTITTVGTTSFTPMPDYCQVGSSNKPATSITFTTTLAGDVNITSFSAEFGGFGGTAGAVTLKVDNTTVGTGSLNGTSDVTVNSTSSATGKVLTVTVTGISKGVKAYYISYTYTAAAADNPYTVTFDDDGSTVTETSGGAGVTLPSRSDVGAYTFAGWSTTEVDPGTTTAPTIIPAGSYNPTENVTLYPVYTKTEGGGTQNKTASVTISDYATAKSWSNATQYTSVTLDESVTATADGHGNTGKYYENGQDWRLYQNESAKVTITTSSGELTSVTFSFSNSNSGTLDYDGSVLTSGTPVAVSGKSAEFTVGNSGNATNGQIRITAIVVNYSVSGSTTTYWSYPVAAAVERPVITVAENPFLFSTTATITCETEGAAIQYSYDNENWTDYTEALTLTQTTTIHAKATKGSDESTVATVKATKNLAAPTVAVTGDLTLDLNGGTNVSAGTLSATVTYNNVAIPDAAVTSWESSDPAVATIDANGEVTLLTTGTVTFTATYAGNSDYAPATGTMTVPVVDTNAPGSTKENPYTVAQALANTPATGNSSTVFVQGIVSSFYKNDIMSDETNYRYNISDDGETTSDQLLVYRGKGQGNVDFSSTDDLQVGDTIIITGELTTYKDTKEFAAGNYIVSQKCEMKDATIVVNESETVAYGTTFSVDDTMIEGGEISLSSSNPAVAMVDGLVVTPKAVGTTIITVRTASSMRYNPGSETFTLKVTAPEGKTKAAVNGYGKVTSTSDLKSGEYLIVYEDGNVAFNGHLETLDGVSNTVAVSINNNVIESSEEVDAAAFTIDVAAGTIKSASGKYIGVSSNSNGLNQSEEASAYTNSFSIDEDGNAVISAVFSGSTMSLRYNNASNQTRFRYYKSGQAPIALYKKTSLTAKLNDSGYATYCSEYPLDFSTDKGYSAWQVTGVKGNAITFKKVTGSVKGGTGLLLMGEPDATVTLTSENSTTELGDNLLKGTLAPTYVESETIYGLSGNTFKKNNAGTFKANKAYILASDVDGANSVRTLSLVFVDPTTGIAETKTMTNEDAIYNLAGQRISKAQRGVNIVGGKKVLVK